MAVLSKDLIKEALMDSLVPTSVLGSETLGRAAFTVLYAVARAFLDAGMNLVLEAPFKRGQCESDLKVLADGLKAAMVVCIASPNSFSNATEYVRRETTGIPATWIGLGVR